jgi:hypothetical protein
MLLGCPVDRHYAIDILRRAGDKHHAWCGLEAFNENALQLFLGWKALVLGEASQARPLHQHDIDGLRRIFHHSFEQLAFSAMSAQIAGIEQPPAARLDLQSVGIKSGMIDEMRCNGERTNLQRLTAFESKRGKSRVGMILRFPRGRESDSFWECRRLPMLTAFRTPT